jgi:hypothetical protein
VLQLTGSLRPFKTSKLNTEQSTSLQFIRQTHVHATGSRLPPFRHLIEGSHKLVVVPVVEVVLDVTVVTNVVTDEDGVMVTIVVPVGALLVEDEVIVAIVVPVGALLVEAVLILVSVPLVTIVVPVTVIGFGEMVITFIDVEAYDDLVVDVVVVPGHLLHITGHIFDTKAVPQLAFIALLHALLSAHCGISVVDAIVETVVVDGELLAVVVFVVVVCDVDKVVVLDDPAAIILHKSELHNEYVSPLVLLTVPVASRFTPDGLKLVEQPLIVVPSLAI